MAIFLWYFLNELLMDSYSYDALLHGWWNTESIWWILGCASRCGLEAKKSFSWPVVIHQDGVVWCVEMEVILNAAYIPEIWHVSMCGAGFFFSIPEGETLQNDVRVNTESGALETRLRYSSDKDMHRESQISKHIHSCHPQSDTVNKRGATKLRLWCGKQKYTVCTCIDVCASHKCTGLYKHGQNVCIGRFSAVLLLFLS